MLSDIVKLPYFTTYIFGFVAVILMILKPCRNKPVYNQSIRDIYEYSSTFFVDAADRAQFELLCT